MLKPLGISQVVIATVAVTDIFSLLMLNHSCSDDPTIKCYSWVLFATVVAVLVGGILIALGFHNWKGIHPYILTVCYAMFGVMAVVACGVSLWKMFLMVHGTSLKIITSSPTVTTDLVATTSVTDVQTSTFNITTSEPNVTTSAVNITTSSMNVTTSTFNITTFATNFSTSAFNVTTSATTMTTSIPNLEESASTGTTSIPFAIKLAHNASLSESEPLQTDIINPSGCTSSTVIKILSSIAVICTFSLAILCFLIAYGTFGIQKQRKEYDRLNGIHADVTESG